MKLINLKSILLTPLQEDYEEKKRTSKSVAQLNVALDFMEASVKVISILSLSVLKEIDLDEYNKAFSNLGNLMLGSYYHTLLKTLKFRGGNDFFKELQAILSNPKYALTVETPLSILEDRNEKVKLKSFITRSKNTSSVESLFLYVLEFRNVFKGHTATINENDKQLVDKVFTNIEPLLKMLDRIMTDIFAINELKFYQLGYNEEEVYKRIVAKEGEFSYDLSPILVYGTCNLYSCKGYHREKIYFINQLNNSKSRYLDYLFNHNFTVDTKEDNWPEGTFRKSIKKLHKKLNYSNENKYLELTAVFVGREDELKEVKNHILNNYHSNTLSVITGRPGVGKSSYVTQLQALLNEEKEDLVSYLFYAIKNQNSDNELKYFTDKVKAFVSNNILLSKEEKANSDDSLTELNQLFEIVANSNKTLLLIIDGLDEFNNAVAFLQNLQLSQIKESNNIHLVFAGRPYKNILGTLTSILPKLDNITLLNKEKTEKDGYSLELETLSKEETQTLILELLPKEIDIRNPKHQKIVETIAEKSESLPIYIYYISHNLREKNLGEHEDYIDKLLEWTEKLPKRLEDYYIETFKDIPALSRRILIAIFFSPYGISLNELYEIFKSEDIDKIAFEHKYFSAIELFLREVEDDYYLFYHLSVKDAIFSYYVELEDITTFDTSDYIDTLVKNDTQLQKFFNDSNYYEELDHLFSFIFRLKSDCDFNHTLQYIIETSMRKRDLPQLKRFMSKGFFHIYYTYCLVSIVTYNTEDSTKSSMKLSHKIRGEVEKFLHIFERQGDKENTELISFAYRLSKLIGDHQKTMFYYEMYNNANLEAFIRICSDINKEGHIAEFKSKFDEWENVLSAEQRDILVDMLSLNVSIRKSFYAIYKRFKPLEQGKLEHLVNNHE